MIYIYITHTYRYIYIDLCNPHLRLLSLYYTNIVEASKLSSKYRFEVTATTSSWKRGALLALVLRLRRRCWGPLLRQRPQRHRTSPSICSPWVQAPPEKSWSNGFMKIVVLDMIFHNFPKRFLEKGPHFFGDHFCISLWLWLTGLAMV